jgi:hypothetical protein
MIDVRDMCRESGKGALTFYCEECEAKYHSKVEVHHRLGENTARLKKFLKIHEECDKSESWIDTHLMSEPKWNETVSAMEGIYAENPGIKFDEAKELCSQRLRVFEELKKELLENSLTLKENVG